MAFPDISIPEFSPEEHMVKYNSFFVKLNLKKQGAGPPEFPAGSPAGVKRRYSIACYFFETLIIKESPSAAALPERLFFSTHLSTFSFATPVSTITWNSVRPFLIACCVRTTGCGHESPLASIFSAITPP